MIHNKFPAIIYIMKVLEFIVQRDSSFLSDEAHNDNVNCVVLHRAIEPMYSDQHTIFHFQTRSR